MCCSSLLKGYLSGDDISQSSVIFSYDTNIRIRDIFPLLGPTSGNFSVRVNGGPFNNTLELRCKFGNIAVQALYIDAGSIRCFAPPHPAGVYPLEVSINDQDYTFQRTPFFYYADEALSRIAPIAGPAGAGGTAVSVYGIGFVNSTYLTCRFGYTSTKGRYVTSNHIVCPSPQLDISDGAR